MTNVYELKNSKLHDYLYSIDDYYFLMRLSESVDNNPTLQNRLTYSIIH